MKKRKAVLDYLAEVLRIFGFIMVFLFCLVKLWGRAARPISTLFALGDQGLSAAAAFQFLGVIALLVLGRRLSFSEKLFRRAGVTKRIVITLLLSIGVTVAAVLVFGWLPLDQGLLPWGMFLLSFLLCFGVSVGITWWREKKENEQLAAGLARKQREYEEAEDGKHSSRKHL